jgi:hypothetical protein
MMQGEGLRLRIWPDDGGGSPPVLLSSGIDESGPRSAEPVSPGFLRFRRIWRAPKILHRAMVAVRFVLMTFSITSEDVEPIVDECAIPAALTRMSVSLYHVSLSV